MHTLLKVIAIIYTPIIYIYISEFIARQSTFFSSFFHIPKPFIQLEFTKTINISFNNIVFCFFTEGTTHFSLGKAKGLSILASKGKSCLLITVIHLS